MRIFEVEIEFDLRASCLDQTPMMPPPGWKDYRLMKFLDASRHNQFASFYNKRNMVNDLISIDDLFFRVLEGWTNPKPLAPTGFFFRSHAAYRGAVVLVLGGQVYEAQALLRLVLEHAAYGSYIGHDDARWREWMSRSESAKSKKSVRENFTHGKMKTHLRSKSKRICEIHTRLYDRLIDFGAHPNEEGFMMNTEINDMGGDTVLQRYIFMKMECR